MTFKAGTEIDVIALDGGEACLSPWAPVGHRSGQGETMLGQFVPPEPTRLATGAQAAAPLRQLAMARSGRIGNQRGQTAGLSAAATLHLARGKCSGGSTTEYRA